MMTIFDEEYILKAYVASKQKEAVEKVEREALMKTKLCAKKMYDKGMSFVDIADILDISLELVKQWLELSSSIST